MNNENNKSSKNIDRRNANMMELLNDTNEKIFDNKVIGFRDLRNNLSEVIGRAVNNFEDITSGNIKKGDDKTVTLISTKVLEDILSTYQFNPIFNFDKATNQHELIIDEINIYSFGNTKEEAIAMLIDLVIDSTKDYFDSIDLNIRIPKLKALYPYYLRIKHCNTMDQLLEVLNLSINS